jgi:hypothetical protein
MGTLGLTAGIFVTLGKAGIIVAFGQNSEDVPHNEFGIVSFHDSSALFIVVTYYKNQSPRTDL